MKLPIKIHVGIKPIAASRPRVPRYGKPYFAKTYKRWRDEAHVVVEEWSGSPIDFPVRVDVLFAIPRARTSKLVVPMGDGDNFEKALYDLLQRKKYVLDDKWITTATWRKRFLPFGDEGYSEVTIYEEDEDVDIR
jgi:Holliday junction resolvase RusA-like endonuclease